MWFPKSGLPRKSRCSTVSDWKSTAFWRLLDFLLIITAKHIFVPSKKSLVVAVYIYKCAECFCMSGCLNEDWLGYFVLYGSRKLTFCGADSRTVWLNSSANWQATCAESYGPWGVLEKLHHWQFYLGELQGWDNAPFKYDDRLEGGELAFFCNPSQLKANLQTSLVEVVAGGSKSTITNLTCQIPWRQKTVVLV